MTVKKSYSVGDTVWIYGINRDNYNSVKGTVIKKFTIDYGNYNDEPYYLIAVPTSIEDLLEVRTWHTISQTAHGAVGGIRDSIAGNIDANIKVIARTGMQVHSNLSQDDVVDEGPSPEQIHAALEKSQQSATHQPLNLKDPKKPKRRFVKRKPKND